LADVMISYARADKARVELLASLLEANGHSTWWDKELLAGGAFRGEIEQEIRRAQVVVVIWSAASVKSEWVRAEARLAHNLRKLLPTKTLDLVTDSIPLPFGELSTIDVTTDGAVLDAVKAALNRPQYRLPWLARLGARVRHQVFTWLGIIGGSITLLAAIAGILKLSETLHFVVENWTGALKVFWRAIFLFRVHVGPYDAVFLTIFLIVTSNLIYAVWRGKPNQSRQIRRLSRGLALTAALAVFGLFGFGGGLTAESKNDRLAEEEFRREIFKLFPSDLNCAEVVANVETLDRGFFGSFAHMFPDDDFESIEARGRAEGCMRRNQVLPSTMGVTKMETNKRFNERAADQVSRFGLLFSMTGNTFAPVIAYLCIGRFVRRRLDVGLLSKRLWLVILGVLTLMLLNQGLIALERTDWRSLLNE